MSWDTIFDKLDALVKEFPDNYELEKLSAEKERISQWWSKLSETIEFVNGGTINSITGILLEKEYRLKKEYQAINAAYELLLVKNIAGQLLSRLLKP